MKLIVDDVNQVYYWTDIEDKVLSPYFDYEEDAIMWKDNLEKGKE